jgi:hypothetical protein
MEFYGCLNKLLKPRTMKKSLLFASLIFGSFTIGAQGLENIIVETYYISDANDATMDADGGTLPVGSVTRRIYVDMLPGYKFQAAYGVPASGDALGHELRIATTTQFFNNIDRGATSPTYTKAQAKNNTVMLDTWLSAGAACSGNFGVLKSADDGVATNVNSDDVLLNNAAEIGVPLTEQDGLLLVTGSSPLNVTTLGGVESQAALYFDAENAGSVFSTFDGAWSALAGATGPNPETNQVLIAQITTDGTLTFELNIQIGTPAGGVERYVAANPVAEEILFPACTYNSDLITSIGEQTNRIEELSIYPNPVSEILNIETVFNTGSLGRYSIYTMRGERVWARTLTGGQSLNTIDVSDLAKGQYVLECIADGKRQTQRFIKH